LVDLHFSTTAAGQIARRSIGNARTIKRRRVRIDGRLKPGLEIKRRIQAYAKAIGPAAHAPFTRARIQEVCEIETLVAQLRADALNGEIKGDVRAFLFELTRLTNTSDRLRHRLGLIGTPEPVEPEVASLDQLLEAE
jgi:hypothetical protein